MTRMSPMGCDLQSVSSAAASSFVRVHRATSQAMGGAVLMAPSGDRDRRILESIRRGRLPTWARAILGLLGLGCLLVAAAMFVPLGAGFLDGEDSLDLLLGSSAVVVLMAAGSGLLRLAVRRSGLAR